MNSHQLLATSSELSSTVSGSTCSMSRAVFVHVPRERLDVFERGSGQHPVPEIENVPTASSRASQYIVSGTENPFAWPEQHRWIEVSLQRTIGTHDRPGFI